MRNAACRLGDMNGVQDKDGKAGAHAAQPRDVFLSYSRDDKPKARKIHDLLQASGISVWWDDMLEGGTRFHEVTEFHLENAGAVVVLWSKISVASHWVHDEATRGRDRGVLVPVSIDGALPPLGFRQFQWLDLDCDAEIAKSDEAGKLVRAVKAKLAAPADSARSDPPFAAQVEAAGTTSIGTPTRRGMLIGGAGIAIAGAAGLGAWGSGVFTGAGGPKRLAVMPFSITAPETGAGAIIEGLAQEVRTRLSRNPLLHVAAQTSSEALSASGKTASAICEELRVDYLLTGGVSLDGERLAVSGELIEGQSDRTVMPISEAGPLASVLTLQGKIASDVIRELTRADEAEDISRSGGTLDVAAYDAFLRGKELYGAGTSEQTDREALARFDDAIRIDPAYAAAHAMRGRTLALIGNLYGSANETRRMYEDAIGFAREATRLAPLFAGGFGVLGDILANRQLDMKAARAPFDTSAKLGEGDAAILSRFALFEARMGDFARGREAIERALALDPLNPGVLRFAGTIEYYSGAYEAAIRRYEDALTIQENMSYARYLVGLAHMASGNDRAAKASFEKERRLVWRETGLAIVEHRLGNQAAAREQFEALKQAKGNSSNYQYMQVLAQWGEQDAALDAMDAAWEQRDSGLVEFRNDPLLDPIRPNPRFTTMLAQIGFV